MQNSLRWIIEKISLIYKAVSYKDICNDAGLPVISMLGDCEVFIENYRGILEYSSEYLKVSTKIGNIRVSGSNLVIYHMNQDEILLRGCIGKVSLKGEADEKDT